MTSSDTKPPLTRARRSRWLGLLAAGVILTSAILADRQLKIAPHPGFLPEDMSLYLFTADLPLSWQHFARTPLAMNLASEASPVLHDIELSLRQWSGIRPTPARWRTWLGPSAVAATDGRDWILCTHPGLLARAASVIFAGKAFPTNQLHQAWREGYLLLSSSSGLIDKALTARPVIIDVPKALSPDALVFEMRAPVRLVVTVIPTPDLVVESHCFLPSPVVSRSSALWTASPMPGNPTIRLFLPDTLSAARLVTLLSAMKPPDFTGGLFASLVTRWSLGNLSSLLSNSGAANTPISCALYGLSTASGVPLPQLTLSSSAKDGFSALLPPAQSSNKVIPYEWNGCAGWMFPLWGDQFSLYGFQRDAVQYLATQEPLAAMLASAPPTPCPGIQDDVVIVIDWKRAAPALEDVATWAAARELLPETNAKDLDAAFTPMMNALSHCGALQVSGKWTADEFLCRGVLTGARDPESAQ